jgi:hypothetical protein
MRFREHHIRYILCDSDGTEVREIEDDERWARSGASHGQGIATTFEMSGHEYADSLTAES